MVSTVDISNNLVKISKVRNFPLFRCNFTSNYEEYVKIHEQKCKVTDFSGEHSQ